MPLDAAHTHTPSRTIPPHYLSIPLSYTCKDCFDIKLHISLFLVFKHDTSSKLIGATCSFRAMQKLVRRQQIGWHHLEYLA